MQGRMQLPAVCARAATLQAAIARFAQVKQCEPLVRRAAHADHGVSARRVVLDGCRSECEVRFGILACQFAPLTSHEGTFIKACTRPKKTERGESNEI
jgi:hypothetical protein